MQFAELKRWQDFRHPGSQGKQYFLGLEQVLQGSGNPAYPGATAGLSCCRCKKRGATCVAEDWLCTGGLQVSDTYGTCRTTRVRLRGWSHNVSLCRRPVLQPVQLWQNAGGAEGPADQGAQERCALLSSAQRFSLQRRTSADTVLLGVQGAWQCLRSSVRNMYDAAMPQPLNSWLSSQLMSRPAQLLSSGHSCAGYGAQAVMTHEGPFKVSSCCQEYVVALQYASLALQLTMCVWARAEPDGAPVEPHRAQHPDQLHQGQPGLGGVERTSCTRLQGLVSKSVLKRESSSVVGVHQVRVRRFCFVSLLSFHREPMGGSCKAVSRLRQNASGQAPLGQHVA